MKKKLTLSLSALVTACLFLALMFSAGSCNKAGIPIYIKVDTAKVNVPINQGANTNAITDVWVQTTSLNIGAYEIPAHFPVLTNGNPVSFLVSAGVWESGQPETRVIYPFYASDTFSIDSPILGSTYTYTPTFKYITATQFTVLENFENGTDYALMPQMDSTQGHSNLGTSCGVITVTSVDSDVVAFQNQTSLFALPAGQEVWLEMDYRTDVPFWVGFEGIYTNGSSSPEVVPVLFVVPTPTWTKLYIRFSDQVSQVAANEYLLYFEAINPTGGNGGHVCIDNIKLLHL